MVLDFRTFVRIGGARWRLAVTALLACTVGAIVSTLGVTPRPGDAPVNPDAPEPGQPA